MMTTFVFICCGAPFLLFGGIWWLNIWMFLFRAEQTTGQIVDEDRMHGKHGASYAPVVEFQGPEGQKVKFTEKIYGAGSGTGIMGMLVMLTKMLWLKQKGKDVSSEINTVVVVYDPNKPQRAHIKSFLYLHFVPVLLIGIGICISMAGIPLFSGFIGKLVDFLANLANKIPWWF